MRDNFCWSEHAILNILMVQPLAFEQIYMMYREREENLHKLFIKSTIIQNAIVPLVLGSYTAVKTPLHLNIAILL